MNGQIVVDDKPREHKTINENKYENILLLVFIIIFIISTPLSLVKYTQFG